MNLPESTKLYGFTFSLNIAKKTGRMNWNGSEPAYAHCCIVGLGDHQATAESEAQSIVAKFGRDEYKFTFIATPKACSFSEEI